MSSNKWIADVGMNVGQDTEFYLSKGFNVVGVEADPILAEQCRSRFAEDVRGGRLHILNMAVGEGPGKVKFYRNLRNSEWGTIDPAFSRRNADRFGAPSEEIEVDTQSIASMLAPFPIPYYIKIDIEGMDRIAVQQLKSSSIRPRYISIEASKSIQPFVEEIDMLKSLGYTAFKIVQQSKAAKWIPPNPAREGVFVQHKFAYGSSGLFGDEAPGEWSNADTVIRRYRMVAMFHDLIGDQPKINGKWLRGAIRRGIYDPGWHDIHARHGDSQ